MRRGVIRFNMLWLLCGLALVSCKKERFKPTWQTRWLAPLFSTELTLGHLIGDTLLTANPDGSLQLVYNNTVYEFNPNENAIRIPDTTVRTTYNINALTLSDQAVVYPFSMGQFALQLINSGNVIYALIGQSIIDNNTGVMAFPAIDNLNSEPVPINATNLFEEATLESGFLDITITNGFPFPISNLVLELRNDGDDSILATQTFVDIDTDESQTQSIDLAGKHVEGNMSAKIIDLDSPGSGGPVTVDTSDAIVVSLQAHDMVVQEATAIFPSQNLVDENQETVYNVGGGAKLTKIRVKEGKLKLVINSSLKQTSHFIYSLPSASINGNANVNLNENLPPAPPGGSSSVTRFVDLAGYEIDMRGADQNSFNTIVNHLVVQIDSTGEAVTLSNSDSVFVDYGLTGLVPSYVEGYLGQQIIEVGPDTTSLAIFNMIKGGQLGLEDVSVSLGIENNLGAEGRINIYDLKSMRAATGNVVSLSSPSVMQQPLFVPRATDNPLTPSHTVFPLNTNNSNIKAWLENMPNEVAYRMDVFLNPNGNNANYHDFAYSDTRIKLNLNVEMPLSLIANDLVLMDTLSFEGLGDKASGLDDVQLRLTTTNGFPLSTDIVITLLDEFGFPIGDLTAAPLHVKPGITGANCTVIEPTVSVLPVPVPSEKIGWLRYAKRAVIKATFDTEATNGCAGYMKIYDTYKLHCKLTGAITYDVTP